MLSSLTDRRSLIFLQTIQSFSDSADFIVEKFNLVIVKVNRALNFKDFYSLNREDFESDLLLSKTHHWNFILIKMMLSNFFEYYFLVLYRISKFINLSSFEFWVISQFNTHCFHLLLKFLQSFSNVTFQDFILFYHLLIFLRDENFFFQRSISLFGEIGSVNQSFFASIFHLLKFGELAFIELLWGHIKTANSTSLSIF